MYVVKRKLVQHLGLHLQVMITIVSTFVHCWMYLSGPVTYFYLLSVQPENEDELKKRQLMELALLNGTYRGFQGNGNILAAATRLNNNNNIIAANNNLNNNNSFGLLMMTAGPSFCKSLAFRVHGIAEK